MASIYEFNPIRSLSRYPSDGFPLTFSRRRDQRQDKTRQQQKNTANGIRMHEIFERILPQPMANILLSV